VFEVLADRLRVVPDLPVGELSMHGRRDVLPALEHRPDLETIAE